MADACIGIPFVMGSRGDARQISSTLEEAEEFHG
jgi:hypothetical protein